MVVIFAIIRFVFFFWIIKPTVSDNVNSFVISFNYLTLFGDIPFYYLNYLNII